MEKKRKRETKNTSWNNKIYISNKQRKVTLKKMKLIRRWPIQIKEVKNKEEKWGQNKDIYEISYEVGKKL